MRIATSIAAALALSLLAACGDSKAPAAAPSGSASLPAGHILIDHILIGVRSGDFPQGKRDASEAKTFAYVLVEKLKAGADWDALKKENSEDGQPGQPGGPYAMADRGVQKIQAGEFGRDEMVPAFGDVGFHLAIGEIGVADYSPQRSKFGFHIIKRVK